MILDKLFAQEQREQAVPSNDPLVCLLADDSLSAEKCMQVPVIAAVVNLIAGTISTLPIKLYKNEDNGMTEVDDYRVYMLNNECGDLLSSTEVKYELCKDWILTGSGFYYVDWSRNKIRRLSYLDPLSVSFSKNGMHIDKSAWYNCDGKRIEPYQMGRVLRNSKTGITGRGLVQESSDYVQMMINIQNLMSRTSRQGGKVILQPETKMAQDALNSLKTAWQSLYGSSDGQSLMVMNSNVGVKQLETQVSSEVSSVKEAVANEIAAALGIPSKILYGGANEQDYALFRNNCLIPLIRMFEKSFDRFLLLEREKSQYSFKFDLDSLTTESLTQRMAGYEKAMSNGVMTVNDVRAKEGFKLLDQDFMRLDLSSVLFDIDSGDLYNINMSTKANLNADNTNWNRSDEDKEVNDVET